MAATFVEDEKPRLPKHMLELPTELLTEVMCNLEWDDLLRVRQVCRRLCYESKQRLLWLNLYLRLATITKPRLFCLEKPLEAHSSSDLEAIILRWKAVDRRWRQEGAAPRLRRQFHVDTPLGTPGSHLISGGHWFISATRDGSIQYYDLNAEEIHGQVLIPVPSSTAPKVSASIAVDMTGESPGLVFNLAVAFRFLGELEDDYFLGLKQYQIWRVQPQLDDHRVVGLLANQLASFSERANYSSSDLSLLGDNLAFTICTKTLDREAVIVNWKNAHGQELFRRKILFGDVHAEGVRLVADHRVLLSRCRHIELFDLKDIPETSSLLDRHALPEAEPSDAITFNHLAISHAYMSQDSTRYLILGIDKIGGLIVHRRQARPQLQLIEQLPCHPNIKTAQLGYRHSAFFHVRRLVTTRISWPDEDANIFSSHKEFMTNYGSPVTFVDEVSGRIVVADFYSGLHEVIEF